MSYEYDKLQKKKKKLTNKTFVKSHNIDNDWKRHLYIKNKHYGMLRRVINMISRKRDVSKSDIRFLFTGNGSMYRVP